ncbi:Transcription accessory protein (S1 RNA-binding domain) [Bacteroides xylanisolvens SD CC 1b]|uniref:Transcription accessory protein (S1 RNA-binding domain) n=1 Tax=Bacteroides xylanisolvens SD CC 1b TaxID=702447 RepID=W6P9U0_9BACE|nr:Transcription accessory protein (S1 RNA-binding domain) [Bacteroides xylanisolvens SD CC 1b]
MELFHKMISGFLGIPERQISSTLHLLGEGATIPFISRYRKEVKPLAGWMRCK